MPLFVYSYQFPARAPSRKRARTARATSDGPSQSEPIRSMPSIRDPRRNPPFAPEGLNLTWPRPSGASAADAIDVDSVSSERVSPVADGAGAGLSEPRDAGDAAMSDEQFARQLQREFEESEQQAAHERLRQELQDREIAARLFRQMQEETLARAGHGGGRGGAEGHAWDDERGGGLDEERGRGLWGTLGGPRGRDAEPGGRRADASSRGDGSGRAEAAGRAAASGRADAGGMADASGYPDGATGGYEDEDQGRSREDAAEGRERRQRPGRPARESRRYEARSAGGRGGPRQRGDAGGSGSGDGASGAMGLASMIPPLFPAGWGPPPRGGHHSRAYNMLAALVAGNRALDSGNYEAILALGEALGSSRSNGASAAQISVLPTSTVLAHEVDKQQECVICLDTPAVGSVVRRLPCLHVFHAACVDEWLGLQSLCPVCKQKISA
eukprot:jgi/Mesvir1/21151/Mv18082-RA.2